MIAEKKRRSWLLQKHAKTNKLLENIRAELLLRTMIFMCPTGQFTESFTQNASIGDFYVVGKCRLFGLETNEMFGLVETSELDLTRFFSS